MKSYDYVIVGAGSAGCVLAARLSEDPDVSVLVIEAGPPDVKETIHVPAAFGQLSNRPTVWPALRGLSCCRRTGSRLRVRLVAGLSAAHWGSLRRAYSPGDCL